MSLLGLANSSHRRKADAIKVFWRENLVFSAPPPPPLLPAAAFLAPYTAAATPRRRDTCPPRCIANPRLTEPWGSSNVRGAAAARRGSPRAPPERTKCGTAPPVLMSGRPARR